MGAVWVGRGCLLFPLFGDITSWYSDVLGRTRPGVLLIVTAQSGPALGQTRPVLSRVWPVAVNAVSVGCSTRRTLSVQAMEFELGSVDFTLPSIPPVYCPSI